MKPTKEANEIKRRVARMLDRLAFSPENVVAAAVETPVMFRDAVEYRKLCLFERNQAKARYERAAADTFHGHTCGLKTLFIDLDGTQKCKPVDFFCAFKR